MTSENVEKVLKTLINSLNSFASLTKNLIF